MWLAAAIVLAACGTTMQDDGAMSQQSKPPTSSSARPDAAASLELAPPSPEKTAPAGTGSPLGAERSVFPPGHVDPSLANLAGMAADDLAARLDAGRDTIAIATATLVTWPDASLGCPAPGMRYKQVPHDGALIELEHAGRFYRYHTGASGRPPFLCDQPLAEKPSATGR